MLGDLKELTWKLSENYKASEMYISTLAGIFSSNESLWLLHADPCSHLHPQKPSLFKSSFLFFKKGWWASLVAQWLRIHLPMQGTRVWVLAQEDPTRHGTAKPVSHNYWARMPQLLKPAPRARAPQQEKPLQWEARAPQWRPNTAKNKNKLIN